jgi:hypothetical protein
MTLTEVQRGQAAWDIRNAGQHYLTWSAPEGHEWVAVRFTVAVLSGPETTVTFADFLDFVMEANKKLYSSSIVSLMNDELWTSLYPGGQDSGWVMFIVPTGAKLGAVGYEPGILQDRIWFAVT